MVPRSEKVLPPLDLTGPRSGGVIGNVRLPAFHLLTCTINEIQEGANVIYFLKPISVSQIRIIGNQLYIMLLLVPLHKGASLI